MSRPSVRFIVPDSPIYVDAFAARTDYVGLGQPSDSPEYRVFVSLAPPTAEEGMMFHVSIEEARFLRSALDTVLDQHEALTRGTN